MSRTTKDAPDWVKRNRVRTRSHPDHICGPSPWRAPRECTIDEPRSANNKHRGCDYEDPAAPGYRHRCFSTKDERRHMYWKPERAATRQSLHTVRRGANGEQPIDDSGVIVYQTRNGPYPRGYWD